MYGSPLFAPLQDWLSQLPPVPEGAALQSLAAAHPRFNAQGRRIHFVDPPEDGLVYESRIWENGAVATRPDNWHDFFNALVWLAFPQSKSAINLCHIEAMNPQGEARGKVRDALTHFDECGMVVLSTRPDLLEHLRAFQWKKLFVEERAAVGQCMRFLLFGHASYEQLLKPFRGMTAKAVLYDIEAPWLEWPADRLRAAVDARLAADLLSGRYQRPRDFQPLPLLGIPGMTAENEMPAYYEDAGHFRPGRRLK